ncbi:hypothetical protein PLCT2_01573 [Planctomycetaceae bacterium]|nr:hypothetical protein PLCT2_01573 [Planctomycetaceae bacterium]
MSILHIHMVKLTEDTHTVSYAFLDHVDRRQDEGRGVIQIDKKTGQILLLEELPYDKSDRYSSCVAWHLGKYRKQGAWPPELFPVS